MALFPGDDLVTVTTPDGRTLTLPRSVVPSSMMPQQIAPRPPGFADEPPADLSPSGPPIPSNTAGMLANINPSTGLVGMQEPAPQHVQPQMPELPPMTVDVEALKKQRAAQQKQQDKAAAAQAAYQASPQGQRATAENNYQGALEKERQAAQHVSDVEAASQQLIGDATAQHNAKLDQLMQKRADDAAAMLRDEDAKYAEVSAWRKKIENTKIDRESDHPIINAIGIALAGIGSAMKHESTNPALEVFWKALDRKVAAQMGDLDLLEKKYGFSKDDLNELKAKNSHKLELYNTLYAGEADKAKRHLDEIAAKSASERTRANAAFMSAQIDERAAGHAQQAVQWGLEYDQKDKHQAQQIGLGYADLGERRRAAMAGEQLKREDMVLDYDKALAAAKASGDKELLKARLAQIQENQKLGVRNLVTKQPLLTMAGRARMDEADKLDAEAAQLENNAQSDKSAFASISTDKAKMLREKAATTRSTALVENQVLANDPQERNKIGEKYGAAQSFMQVADEIQKLYDDAGRGFISKSKLQQELQAKMGLLAVKAKDAWQLGAWDKGSAKLVADIIGGDPTNAWDTGYIAHAMGADVGKDPEGFKNRLNAVTQGLQQDVENQLGANSNWDGKDTLFMRKKPVDMNSPNAKAGAAISEGQTPQEAEAAATPGTLGKIRDQVYALGGLVGEPQYKVNIRNAQNSGSPANPGLDKQQAQGFDIFLKQYKAGDAKAGEALIAQVLTQADARPDLAIALAHNIRDFAGGKLYTQMRAAVPKDSALDKQLSYEETTRVGSSIVPTPMIANEIMRTLDANNKVTDSDGWHELARRAADGDPEAKRALLEIAKQAGTRKAGQ